MRKTVVGLFRHSGDADLVAAHLRETFALDADKLDVIGQAELSAAGGAGLNETDAWLLAALADTELDGLDGPGGLYELDDLEGPGARDPVARRWGDQVRRGRTLVVARCDDPDQATEIAREMRRAGAHRVDLLAEDSWPLH